MIKAIIQSVNFDSAKEQMAELLKESGDLHGEIRAIVHPVKFFEKGDKPLGHLSVRYQIFTI